jgi:hypothetical protein
MDVQQSEKRRKKFYKSLFLHKGVLMTVIACLMISSLAGCSSPSSKDSSAAVSKQASTASEAKADSGIQDQFGASQAGAQDTKKSSVKQVAVGQSKAAAPAASMAPMAVTPAIGTDSSAGFNRKLIYKANLVMPVEDYGKAQTQLRDLVALSGAYILQFSENANVGERGGNFTIKVDAKGFASLLDGLEKISPSLQRNVQGQDVTEEYVDLDSRLKAKQSVEARLLAFMDKATKTDELLAFSGELAKVQEEIETIKGRMRYLDQNVSFSTVELRMYQQTGSKSPVSDPEGIALGERLHKAIKASLNVLAIVLQGILVFLAGALPILILLAIIMIPIWVYRRQRNRKLAETRNLLKQQNAVIPNVLAEPKENKEE